MTCPKCYVIEDRASEIKSSYEIVFCALHAAAEETAAERDALAKKCDRLEKLFADYRDCVDISGAIAEAVMEYDSDDVTEVINPILQPLVADRDRLASQVETLRKERNVLRLRMAYAAKDIEHRSALLEVDCESMLNAIVEDFRAALAGSPVAEPLKCAVCGLEPGTVRNRAVLGTDDTLCSKCFRLWYDEGITDRDEMRKVRGVGSPVAEEKRQ